MKYSCFLFSTFVPILSTEAIDAASTNSREPSHHTREKQLSQDDIDQMAQKIFNEIWWIKGTQERLNKLIDHIHNIFGQHTEEEVSNILSRLLSVLIGNIGGYTGGLTSFSAGKMSRSSTTSDNLIMAHYVHDLMHHFKMSPTCKTWKMTTNSFGIPNGTQELSCSEFLQENPIDEKEKRQEGIESLVNSIKNPKTPEDIAGEFEVLNPSNAQRKPSNENSFNRKIMEGMRELDDDRDKEMSRFLAYNALKRKEMKIKALRQQWSKEPIPQKRELLKNEIGELNVQHGQEIKEAKKKYNLDFYFELQKEMRERGPTPGTEKTTRKRDLTPQEIANLRTKAGLPAEPSNAAPPAMAPRNATPVPTDTRDTNALPTDTNASKGR